MGTAPGACAPDPATSAALYYSVRLKWSLERLTAWSNRRQLLGRSGGDPVETLRSVIGVYSTHPTAPLALLARCNQLTREDFSGLDQQRRVARFPAMRGSSFMVPTETAARVFAAARSPRSLITARLQSVGLDFVSYARLTPLVLDCCASPVTPSELRKCADTDEDVYMVARVLAREARILRVGGSLRTDQLKYVATRSWLGQELEPVDADDALAWLAREYLSAFGPARVADFAWWAGTSRRAASVALARSATVEQDGLLLLEADLKAFETCQPLEPDAIDVLPKWDSLTMGYAPDGRQRFIDDEYLPLAYTSVTGSPGATSGDGMPLILRGGRAVGTWTHRFDGQRMQITIRPFAKQTKLPDDTFGAVGELLNASSVGVIRVEATRSSPAP